MAVTMNKSMILICGEKDHSYSVLKFRLLRLGYAVCGIARTGHDALEISKKHKPDLVIMDITFRDGLQGIKVAEVIPEKWDIPIIFLAADNDSDKLEDVNLAYPFGYLLEPCLEKDLKITVEMALYIGKVDAERRRVEKALENSELWLRNTFESLEEAVFVVTTDRRLVNFNKAAEKMLGYTKNEVADLSTAVLHVNREYYLEFGEKINEAFEKGQTAQFEFLMKRKNGEIFPTEHSVSLIKNNSGESVGIVSVIRDITLRKEAEIKLIESEERFRGIVENTDAGYFYIDKDGYFQDVNKAWLKMYKFSSREEVIGKHFTSVQISNDVDKACTFVRGIMEGKEKFLAGEFSRKCTDGSTGYHSFSAKPVFHSGKADGIEGFIIDTTERKLFEEQREKLVADLQKALQEIKTLEGFLPICSYCKKIKDDKGYWRQVEQYISERTEAQFSHGLCPECCVKFYSDFIKE